MLPPSGYLQCSSLILLDEGIICNSAHLLGLYSVVNPDAVKDIKIYRGGIPVRYGGRLSSVLDIRQREGNYKEFCLKRCAAATGRLRYFNSRLFRVLWRSCIAWLQAIP